ncbi:hypothetical protein H5P28_04090 [Ruficoccus amylovorans]|uniref:Pilus assembly protein, PilO n=1 Tax=Ruficoccus amylovorans TaxID=1804625 RepID=A0A842HD13_9BACT|nr:hypothetical protein [Ruficoccus amylovorans]MBC2593434.1 hypothetical protein [Ruficoccus amylovorans]
MSTQKIISMLKQHPLAVACAVLAVVLLAVVALRGTTYSDSEQRYDKLVSEVDEMEVNEKNSIGLSEDVETINQLAAEIESRLMREEARADHYRYFLSLAEDSKVSLTDPSLSTFLVPGTKGGNLMTSELAQAEYRLQVKGEFKQVMDFLYRLSVGRYLTRVDGMSLTANSALGNDMVQAALTVRILASAPPKPASTKKK